MKFSDGKLFSNCYYVRYVILYAAYGTKSILRLVLDETSYFDFLHFFLSFPSSTAVSKTPDFFWDCQLKIRLTRRF